MNGLLLLIPVFMFSMGVAHAEPLENVHTSILNHDDNSATVQLNWNYDDVIQKYEIGCVSCIPNVVKFSTDNNFIMNNITALPNSSIAMLYIIAYDSNDKIITAKQILVDIGK